MRLPAVLGKYELIERLATGGMAEVFLARAKGPAGVQKTLVVKRIRPEYADDPRFVNMFINEARIGVHLAHPNIVHVFELGRAAGTWFIAMEYVPGATLEKTLALRRGRPLDLSGSRGQSGSRRNCPCPQSAAGPQGHVAGHPGSAGP